MSEGLSLLVSALQVITRESCPIQRANLVQQLAESPSLLDSVRATAVRLQIEDWKCGPPRIRRE